MQPTLGRRRRGANAADVQPRRRVMRPRASPRNCSPPCMIDRPYRRRARVDEHDVVDLGRRLLQASRRAADQPLRRSRVCAAERDRLRPAEPAAAEAQSCAACRRSGTARSAGARPSSRAARRCAPAGSTATSAGRARSSAGAAAPARGCAARAATRRAGRPARVWPAWPGSRSSGSSMSVASSIRSLMLPLENTPSATLPIATTIARNTTIRTIREHPADGAQHRQARDRTLAALHLLDRAEQLAQLLLLGVRSRRGLTRRRRGGRFARGFGLSGGGSGFGRARVRSSCSRARRPCRDDRLRGVLTVVGVAQRAEARERVLVRKPPEGIALWHRGHPTRAAPACQRATAGAPRRSAYCDGCPDPHRPSTTCASRRAASTASRTARRC